MRRLKRVTITNEALIHFLTVGPKAAIECIGGLPADAEFVGSFRCRDTMAVSLVYRSDSFEFIGDDDVIPPLMVQFRRCPMPVTEGL